MRGRMVSKSTYHNHAPYRRSNAQQVSAQPSQSVGQQNEVPGTSDAHRDKRQRTRPSPPTEEGLSTCNPTQMHPPPMVRTVLSGVFKIKNNGVFETGL